MEIPFVGKRVDVLNKRACVAYFNGQTDNATELWMKAGNTNNQHYYSVYNLGMKRFRFGEVSQGALRTELADTVFMHPSKGKLSEASILIATGHRRMGLEMLKEYIEDVEARKCKRRGVSSKVCLTYDKAVKLRDNIEADTEGTIYLQQFQC